MAAGCRERPTFDNDDDASDPEVFALKRAWNNAFRVDPPTYCEALRGRGGDDEIIEALERLK